MFVASIITADAFFDDGGFNGDIPLCPHEHVAVHISKHVYPSYQTKPGKTSSIPSRFMLLFHS